MQKVVVLLVLGVLAIAIPVMTRPVGSVPPEGLYVTLRNDAIQQVAKELSLQVASTVNQDTSTPDISGSTSSVSYTFSQFLYDIDMEGFYYNGASPPALSMGWSVFDFIIQFNYHICAKSWPNPCENGWVQVYTTNSVKLQVDATLSMSGPNPSLVASDSQLLFNQGDVMVYVQCTDTFCLIPVDDISQAVAQNFRTSFQTAVQTGINKIASAFMAKIATDIHIPAAKLSFFFNGNWLQMGSTLAFALDGAFSPGTGTQQQPPFSPTVSPPDAAFSSPAGQLDVLWTGYVLETAAWALDMDGFFAQTITAADVPASSPVQLNTNDETLQSGIPGLANYPNMNITVTTKMLQYSPADINSTGIHVSNNVFEAVFALSNATYQHAGWAINISTSFDVKLVPTLGSSALVLTASFSNFAFAVGVESSAVGSVDPELFEDLLQLISSLTLPTPSGHIPIPAGFTVASPAVAVNAGYVDVSAAVSFHTSKDQTCGDGVTKCPLDNTCCQNGASWGCCILPSAACCGDGSCCPQGTTCDGGYCDDSNGLMRYHASQLLYAARVDPRAERRRWKFDTHSSRGHKRALRLTVA